MAQEPRAASNRHGEELRAWADAVKAAAAFADISHGDLARRLEVPRPTLLGWLSGDRMPSPWALPQLSAELHIPLFEQHRLLGWTPSEIDTPVPTTSVAEDSRQLRLAAARISRALEELELRSEPALAVARRVLEPSSELGAAFANRWQASLATRIHGAAYRYRAGLFVEFARRRQTEPLSWSALRSTFRGYFERRAPTMYQHDPDDPPQRDEVKRERLELRALLDNEPAAAYGNWFGEGGRRWKALSAWPEGSHTHLFFPQDDRRSRAVLDSVVPLSGGDRIVVVASAFGSATRVGRMLADALGWRFVNLAEAATAAFGRPRQGIASPHRAEAMASVAAKLLTTTSTEPTVFGMVRADTYSHPSILKLVAEASQPLFVYLRQGPSILAAWDRQQADNVEFESREPAAFNRVDRIAGAQAAFEHALHSRPEGSYLAFSLDPADVTMPGESCFEDPVVSDILVQAAWKTLQVLRSDPLHGLLLQLSQQLSKAPDERASKAVQRLRI